MAFENEARALRAKVQLAVRHAHEQRDEARIQRERARFQREAERDRAEAAQRRVQVEAPALECARCHGVWYTQAVIEATRRNPVCPLCGGRLTPVP